MFNLTNVILWLGRMLIPGLQTYCVWTPVLKPQTAYQVILFYILSLCLIRLLFVNKSLARKKSFKLRLQAKRSLFGFRVTLKQSQPGLKQHTVTMSTHQHSPLLFPKILLFRLYKGGQTNRQKPQCLSESARSPMVQQASGCLSCNTRLSVGATLWAASLSGRGDKGPVTGKSSGNRTRGKESDGEGRLIQGNTDRGNQTSSGGVGTRSYWNIKLGMIPRLWPND